MPRVHPESYTLAYQLGYFAIRAINRVEYCWTHAKTQDSFPGGVERELDALSRLLRALSALLTSQRAQQATQLIEQVGHVLRANRRLWMDADHESALATIESAEPEELFSVEGHFINSSLIPNELSDFWNLFVSFVGHLPRDLRNLIELGRHLASAFFEVRSGPQDLERAGVQPETFVHNVLPERISDTLALLPNRFAALRELDLNLEAMSYYEILRAIHEYHKALLAILETQLAIVQPARVGPGLPRQINIALALYEFGVAQLAPTDGNQPSYQEVYDYLSDCASPNRPEGRLVRFETFCHYVSEAHRRLNQRQSRGVSENYGSGRSIVRSSDL